jgi:hypothetical protein
MSSLFNDKIFKFVNVIYKPNGVSTIFWEFHGNFLDPLPYNFTLQKNKSQGDPSQWEDIATGINVFSLSDTNTGQFSKGFYFAYRIKLVTPKGTYFSQVAQSYHNLTYKQWNIYRAMLRRHMLVPKHLKKYNIKLLKRKRAGTPCTCKDATTKLILNADCADCFGTGIEGGFWESNENFIFILSPDRGPKETAEDANLMRGTVFDETKQAIIVGSPFVDYGDVIVNLDNGIRYFIHNVNTQAEFSGIPVNYLVLLKILPPTHPIYKFAVS